MCCGAKEQGVTFPMLDYNSFPVEPLVYICHGLIDCLCNLVNRKTHFVQLLCYFKLPLKFTLSSAFKTGFLLHILYCLTHIYAHLIFRIFEIRMSNDLNYICRSALQILESRLICNQNFFQFFHIL